MRTDIINFLNTIPPPEIPFLLRPGETIINWERWKKVNLGIIQADRVDSKVYKRAIFDLNQFNRKIKSLNK
jgi:hypothetical protein